jgi:hypothetical protein
MEDHFINGLRLRLVLLVFRDQGLDPLLAFLQFLSEIRQLLGMFLQEFFFLLGLLLGGFLQEFLESFIFCLKYFYLGGKGVD